jgi:hypothetical protein
MGLKINGNTFATRRYLSVDGNGVEFCETATLGGCRRFGFHEVDLVLLSSSEELSLQVGQEIFRIQVKMSKPKHKKVVETLIRELGDSGRAPGR